MCSPGTTTVEPVSAASRALSEAACEGSARRAIDARVSPALTTYSWPGGRRRLRQRAAADGPDGQGQQDQQDPAPPDPGPARRRRTRREGRSARGWLGHGVQQPGVGRLVLRVQMRPTCAVSLSRTPVRFSIGSRTPVRCQPTSEQVFDEQIVELVSTSTACDIAVARGPSTRPHGEARDRHPRGPPSRQPVGSGQTNRCLL